MLDFWYSERSTRQVKLIVSILTCVIIYFCSSVEKLEAIFVGLSLVIGALLHLLYTYRLKISDSNPYKRGFDIVSIVIPISLLILLIIQLPSQNKVFLSIQSLGFMLLGLFILSIYQNRAKRID